MKKSLNKNIRKGFSSVDNAVVSGEFIERKICCWILFAWVVMLTCWLKQIDEWVKLKTVRF